ncbi:MAG: MFS transporter [Armatimonadetes bacterium]|nr:MFS transporter [Armatimonadota bacterium]
MTLVSLAPTHEAPQIVETRRPVSMDRPRLLGITLGHFLNDFHMAWLAPLLPLLVVRFHLTLALAGLLGTILTTSSALSQPFFALAADRLRRSVLAAVGPVMTVAAMSLIGILPTYTTLIAALLVAAAGTAIFHPQGAAAAGFHSGDRRATGLSLFVAAGELAFALGPLYISAVVQWQALRWTLPAGLPGLLVAATLALLALRWPTAQPAHHREPLGRALSAQRRMLFLLWVFVVTRSIVSIAFLTFLPLLLTREQGASLVQGGTAVFLFGGIGAVGGVMGGMLADRIGRRPVLGLSFILSVPLLALFLVLPSAWRLALLPLAGIILYLSAPVTIVMAQEGLPQRASLASSIVMGLAWGIGGLALTLLGAIADRIGLRETLLLTLSLALVGVAAVLALPRPRPTA